MRFRRRNWWILMMLIIAIMVVVTVFLWQSPPVEIIAEARQNLTQAEKMHAPKYSGELFTKATRNYDSAMIQWNKENEKFFISRDFDLVESYANKANRQAQEAIKQTALLTSKTKDTLGPRISKLEKQAGDFDRKYGNFPFNESDRQQLTHGKLLLSESIIAFKQSNFQTAKIKLDSAESIISQLTERYGHILKDYFRNYPEWMRWVETSIAGSKRDKTYCIIIDKYSHKCLLYKTGVLNQKYQLELGSNWMGDKNHQGDMSTPEGIYKILGKKSNGETRYYKAFLLNYPNEEDKKRFMLNKQNGLIDQDAGIGNLIEIHGHGGKGTDWTDGCIALMDSDMDKLFSACSVGTRVTIVGSVRSLDEIINSADE